ncbi:MAG: ABC transporter ATP-binding protein [Microbacterium sp.]
MTSREPRTGALPPAVGVDTLVVSFGRGAHATTALNGVSLTLDVGRTMGIVGESGSGKTTLAKTIVGIVTPDSGRIEIDGLDRAAADRTERATLRRTVQMIPQDPYSSFDPRRTVGHALGEAINPRRPRARTHEETIVRWLERVRLPADTLHRYPHELSGGQRQRVAIARALIVEPKLVVADEITSALDVSVQAEVLDLVDTLRSELNLSMLFISHNLAVVQRVSDEVLVLLRGEVVEFGPVDRVFEAPSAPYTRQLLDAVPGAPGFTL